MATEQEPAGLPSLHCYHHRSGGLCGSLPPFLENVITRGCGGRQLPSSPPHQPCLSPEVKPFSTHTHCETQRHLTSWKKITAPEQPRAALSTMKWNWEEEILDSLTSPPHQDSRTGDNRGISSSPPDPGGLQEVRMGRGKEEEVTRAAGAGRMAPVYRAETPVICLPGRLRAHNHFWSPLYGSAVSRPILQKKKMRLQ